MSLEPAAAAGITHLRSPFSVDETLTRLKNAFRSHGLKLFAHIDHSREAEGSGLAMRPTHLLLFGNPLAGTPLMIASPTLAIDLPSKALVWRDEAGAVWVSYNDPEYLRQRHSLPAHFIGKLSGITALAAKALE